MINGGICVVDMPVYIQQQVANFDIASSVKIADYSKLIPVLQQTWDAQTFSDLQQGKVAVPDDVINNYLAQAIAGSEKVSEIKITSLNGNQFKIHAQTASVGKVEMLCSLQGLQHDKNHSILTIQLLSKKLPDKPIMSFLFSHVSMAMVVKVVGPIDVGKGIHVEYEGNKVNIDFHQALYESELGKFDLYGYNLLDAVNITNATTKQGGVTIETGLDLPEQVSGMVTRVLAAFKNEQNNQS